MKKYKIEKIDWEKQYLDCMWYDGLVAKIHTEKGQYCIFANGQVKATLLSKNENNELEEIAYVKGDGTNFYQRMNEYIKNDKELNEIRNGEHSLYELDIVNNNWLEVDLLNKDNEYEELDIVFDSCSVKDAVKEVIEMIPDIEKELDSEKYYE